MDNDLDDRQTGRENVPLECDRGPRCPRCNTGHMSIVQAIAADTLRGPTQEVITFPPRASPAPVACEMP